MPLIYFAESFLSMLAGPAVSHDHVYAPSLRLLLCFFFLPERSSDAVCLFIALASILIHLDSSLESPRKDHDPKQKGVRYQRGLLQSARKPFAF